MPRIPARAQLPDARPLSQRPAFWLGAGGLGLASIALGNAIATLDATVVLALVLALGGIAALVAVLGGEGLIVLTGLASFGLIPYVDPGRQIQAGLPLWFLALGATIATMLFLWAFREATARPAFKLERSVLLVCLFALLTYTLVAMATSSPMQVPSLAGPFVAFPTVALATYLWLSHEAALDGLRRAIPLVAAIGAAWALAYVGGSAGVCPACIDAVSSDSERLGILGPGSRLYTPGQNAFLALTLVAFAAMLRRATPVTVALATLALAAVALQSSRAQYTAVAAGLAILLAWRFGRLGPSRRLALVAVTLVALVTLFSSPIGERSVSGYADLQQGGGTAGYRLRILDDVSQNWSWLGTGVSYQTLNLGFDTDLGLSNTLLILGFVGGGLQMAALGLGFVRGLTARTLAGVTIAAVLLLAAAARPSLPLIEYGHSTGIYGAALGFAAALRTKGR